MLQNSSLSLTVHFRLSLKQCIPSSLHYPPLVVQPLIIWQFAAPPCSLLLAIRSNLGHFQQNLTSLSLCATNCATKSRMPKTSSSYKMPSPAFDLLWNKKKSHTDNKTSEQQTGFDQFRRNADTSVLSPHAVIATDPIDHAVFHTGSFQPASKPASEQHLSHF